MDGLTIVYVAIAVPLSVILWLAIVGGKRHDEME